MKAAPNPLPGACPSLVLSGMDASVLEARSLLLGPHCILTNPELGALCSEQKWQNRIRPILIIANLRGFKIWGQALQFDPLSDFWEDKEQPRPGLAKPPSCRRSLLRAALLQPSKQSIPSKPRP